mgnify:CR=1 FL=1
MIDKAIVLEKIEALKVDVAAMSDVVCPDMGEIQAQLDAAVARISMLEDKIRQIDAIAQL